MCETWSPCNNLISNPNKTDYAVLVLNCELNFPPSVLLNLWEQAKVKLTVDGGTARWLTWLNLHKLDLNNVSPPDLITGDMDSLSKDVLEYFVSQHNSKAVETPNQDETDFTKALRQLKSFCTLRDLNVQAVYVLADTSGRFDQILANINTLYKAQNIVPHMKVFQVATNSITWVLSKGNHSIEIPKQLIQSREWCALIPFNWPCHVSTTGLKWNLSNSKMEFGGLVSTSNTYEGSQTVTVGTDNNLVWSMGIDSLLTSS